MPWLLNLAYLLLIVAVSPLLLYRRLVQGKYRDGWREKFFGSLPPRDSSRPCLWLHAVSVGEVLQLQTVLKELAARHPEAELVITTTTGTGLAVAREKYPQHTVCYFPLDFSWAVRRAIQRIKPTAIILVELELWPNFILAASRATVPIALINGRISAKSYRGYRRIRFLMKPLLHRLTNISVQTDEYAERFNDLGAPVDRMQVTGSIKFDRIETNRTNPRTEELRQAFGLQRGETVFIAGSTQAPEEEFALDCWQALRPEFPSLRLVLVPRHKERFEEVAQLVERRGLPLLRRSLAQDSGSRIQDSAGQSRASDVEKCLPLNSQLTTLNCSELSTLNSQPVLLLDTLGELAACWGLADIAFVGGSLTNRGGQNMIEPAGYGAAVLFGPNTWNFRDVTEALLSRQAARVVRSREELIETVRFLLRNPNEAERQGAAAQAFVLSQRGATAKTIEAILQLISNDQRSHQRAA